MEVSTEFNQRYTVNLKINHSELFPMIDDLDTLAGSNDGISHELNALRKEFQKLLE